MSSRKLRWIVRAGDPRQLGALLLHIGCGEALQRGAVFVDGRRAQDVELILIPGHVVEIYGGRSSKEGVKILAERAGLIAVYKPPELPTEPDRRGAVDSLLGLAAEALGLQVSSLHALGRLDVGVSGVLLLSRDAASTARAQAARAQGLLRRRYVGLCARSPDPASGTWAMPLSVRKHSRVLTQPALSRYAFVASALRGAALALEPVTGRMHQLRIHAAAAGVPMLGDRRYGGALRVTDAMGHVSSVDRIALHSFCVELVDGPGEPWRVEAPLPDDLQQLWGELGGEIDELRTALARPTEWE
jgi:23S rRNA-/tRNA-specific pseudouridylate synthase